MLRAPCSEDGMRHPWESVFTGMMHREAPASLTTSTQLGAGVSSFQLNRFLPLCFPNFL